jgi:tetraacyldisaccharide 4'-kinase
MADDTSRGVNPLLIPLSCLYALGSGVRRSLYSAGILKRYRPDARTVSVGNIAAGGTGKSPLVELLARELSDAGVNVVVVRRSSTSGPFGGDYTDEERAFAENVPCVQQVSGRSKAEAARKAVEQGPDLILVDDGFQTVSLERDLDVVTVDAASPFGNGRLLPAGILREPPRALERAGVVVLTHCEEVFAEEKNGILRELRNLTAARIFEASYVPTVIGSPSDGTESSLVDLHGRRVFAFCGIGRPAGFFDIVGKLDCRLVGRKAFRDHHAYTAEELAEIEGEAAHYEADVILTTQKDAARLRDVTEPGSDIYFLKIRLEVTDGDELIRLVKGNGGE